MGSTNGTMLFQDRMGRILHSDEVDEMSTWDIETSGIRLYNDDEINELSELELEDGIECEINIHRYDENFDEDYDTHAREIHEHGIRLFNR